MLFRVPLVVSDRVYAPREAIPKDARERLYRQFVHANPAYEEQERAGRRNHGEPPTYSTWRAEPDGRLSFPRGGFKRVREVLASEGLGWSVVDARVTGNAEDGATIPDHRFTLYPHQAAAVDAAIARQNCLVRAPTGAGKTVCGFEIVSRLKLPALVLVWSGNLMEQWIRRAGDELGLAEEDVGVVGEGSFRLRPVTVGMLQSVFAVLRRNDGDARELRSTFGVVIGDEVQRAAAPTIYESFDAFPAKYRVGISADETRKDEKEFLVYDVFGDVVADIPLESLVASGHVLDVEIRVVPTSFRADWYKYRQDFNRLLAQMRKDEERNNLALSLVEEEVRAGERVLVFSHRVEHCRDLDSALISRGIQSGVLLGGASEKVVFRRTREGILSGELRAAVGTVQAVGQGLDLPAVSRGVLTTPLHNNRQQFGQVRGRVCRTAEGKEDARLYVLADVGVYGKGMVAKLAKSNARVVVRAPDGAWVPAERWLRGIEGRRAARALFHGG